MPRGLRHAARSISFLSPIARRPDGFFAMKIASLIFRPVLLFLVLTCFQSLSRPSFSFGSSSRISLSKQALAVSRARFRPPGNIQSRSRFLRTRMVQRFLVATSFDDFVMVHRNERNRLTLAAAGTPRDGPGNSASRNRPSGLSICLVLKKNIRKVRAAGN